MSSCLSPALPAPDVEAAALVVPPPGAGRGHWAGAPSACYHDGRYYLAYRLRAPLGEGRGFGVVVAASDDGRRFEPLLRLDREPFGSASLERPALVKGPGDTWRLYVSCATKGSYHWWIDALTADAPDRFDPSARVTVLPGGESLAVKDPVVAFDGRSWLMWACCHPLDDPDATDRMWSSFASSEDGLSWQLGARSLSGRPGLWDQRGTRVTSVVRTEGGWSAFYDGRKRAEDNAEEVTGVATGPAPDQLRSLSDQPAYTSPWGTGSLRYLTVVRPLDGRPGFMYFEACLPDGSHGLFGQPLAG